jgi:hypothetical protein
METTILPIKDDYSGSGYFLVRNVVFARFARQNNHTCQKVAAPINPAMENILNS